MNPFRYPGPQPFTSEQKSVFYGRNEELDEVSRLVRREPWVVLYGKSGLGKSSLLNAGLSPRLAVQDAMQSVFIRFHAWTEDQKDSALSIATNLLKKDKHQQIDWLEDLVSNDDSLWRVFKEKQITLSGTTLLIFDQFEELFTFPKQHVEEFAKSLAEVFYIDIPDRYRKALEIKSADLTAEQHRLLHESLSLRVVTAIRTDRMAQMHNLRPFLPGTLDHLYELRPLSLASAEEAVLNPAFDAGEFLTPRFDFDDDALDLLLGFLSAGRKQDIESFQLQILCEHLEKNVVKRSGRTRIETTDIADPQGILENYYLGKIDEIDGPDMQLAARRLIEEGLAQEGDPPIRLSLHQAQILKYYGISTDLLETLVNQRLLRAEAGAGSGYTYELPHDTLLEPILKIKRERLELEEQKRQEAETTRLKTEAGEAQRREQEALRQKDEAIRLKNEALRGRTRARMFSWISSMTAVLAFGLGVIAFLKQKEANVSSEMAIRKQIEAEVEKNIAKDALFKFQNELNAKERLRFNNLESRAIIILDAGGCPIELLQEMQNIVQNHSDSLSLKEKIKFLNIKNSTCK